MAPTAFSVVAAPSAGPALSASLREPAKPRRISLAGRLPADQAVNFYVQSALTVQCLLTLRGWTLPQLAEKLIAASGPDLVSYDLPEIQSTSFLSSCVAALTTP